MALALAPHKIRVNAVGPGSIMTEVLTSVVGDKVAMNRSAARASSSACSCISNVKTIFMIAPSLVPSVQQRLLAHWYGVLVMCPYFRSHLCKYSCTVVPMVCQHVE